MIIQNEIIISEAQLIDVVVMKDLMREEHAIELFKLSDETRERGLLKCYMNSTEKYTARINGEIVMMFGVDGDCIWALGTKTIDLYPKLFTRTAITCIKNLLSVHYHLFNYIDDDYKTGIRFAEFLGAKVGPRMIINDFPFRRVDFFDGGI